MGTTPAAMWLQPGQPQMLWLARGAHLLVQRGGVAIVLPSNGGVDPGQLARTTLPAGSAHPVRCGGWVRLEAMGPRPAQVLYIAPARGRDRTPAAQGPALAQQGVARHLHRPLDHLGRLLRQAAQHLGWRAGRRRPAQP